jgi:hypothetical protein
MAIRIQLRRDTAANWTSSNPVLRAGELGIETDTLKFKIGNGSSTWTQITSYANITPTGLSNSLGDYILSADQGNAGGPAELDSNGDLIVPQNSVILWNDDAHSYSTTLTATQPTADRTITFKNADGTVAFTTDIPATTDSLSEGTTNKYFSAELAQDATADALAAGTHTNITVTYNDAANSISLAAAPGYVDEQAVDAVAAALAAGTHTNITVGYNDAGNAISLTGAVTYTDENAQDAVGNALGTGLSYNDTTGAISVDTTAIQARVADVSDTEIGYLNGVTSAIQTQLNDKAPIASPTFTGAVTLSGAPTSDLHAATKLYVDNVTAGLNFHEAVHAASVNNLAVIYNNGTSGVGATLTANTNRAFSTIDGESVVLGERVLIKNQTDAKQNGIYTLTTAGSVSVPWVLTRATDADNNPTGEMKNGDFTFVQRGTVNASIGFINNSATNPIVIGTDDITYTEFNAGKTVVAGNGISETSPGTLAINTAITADLSTAQTLTNKTLTSPKINEDVAVTVTATELNVLDGITSTTAELNILDGVTSTAAEINILDGATLSTTELNYVDGVTSAIQTQLDGKVDESIITAKGDLYVGSASSTLDNLAVGTNGYLLTADSNEALGVKWAAAPVSLPDQTGNSGEYLTTNGTVASWAVIPVTSAATPTVRGTVFGRTGINGSVGLGESALGSLTSGNANTALGNGALTNNTTAYQNTAVGKDALATNTTGQWNVAVGYASLLTSNSSGNVALGQDSLGSLSSGDYNIAIGFNAGGGNGATNLTTGSNNIIIGKDAISSSPTVSNEITIGNSSITRFRIPGLGIDWTTSPIVQGTATVTANTATTIDTNALNAFTSAEYVVSLKQGSKVRTSKVIVQTDGTSVDMTEFAITETGGVMSGVAISAAVSSTNAVLQVTVTDAATTNVTVKFSEIRL